MRPQGAKLGTPYSRSFDHTADKWDEVFEDIEAVLKSAKTQIVWGGQHYAMPPTNCILIWNKHQHMEFSHAELAWTNMTKANKLFDLPWLGAAARRVEPAYHPTQKPLPLMQWCLSMVDGVASVVDPFMGAGTTLVAAKLAGIRAVGIEINEEYCQKAVERLRQGVLPFAG